MGCNCGGKKSTPKRRSSPAPIARSTNSGGNNTSTVINSNTRLLAASPSSPGMDRSRLEQERIRREILQRKLGK